MSERLPVADRTQVRRDTTELLRTERGRVTRLVVLTLLAGAAGLVGPYLLGRIIDMVEDGTATLAAVDLMAVGVVVAACAQLVLTRYARRSTYRFGEHVLRRLREDFVGRALSLPTRVVERSGTGDLTTRASADVATVGETLRGALPDIALHTFQLVVLFGAIFWISPLLGLCVVVSIPLVVPVVRWYLRRSRQAYLAEGSTLSGALENVSATAEGGRTVEGLGIQGDRIEMTDRDVGLLYRARRGTLRLRTVLFPFAEGGFMMPSAIALLVGGVLYLNGGIALGALVTCLLYIEQAVNPMIRLTQWVEQIQRATASFARLRGMQRLPEESTTPGPVPEGDGITLVDVRYAYVPGHDVLRGIDLEIRPGERIAVVGPSGAGKTTIGRLLSGADVPGSGRVLVGGVPVGALSPGVLRERVVLVDQEHHVFTGSLRENIAIAAPDADDTRLLAALAAVDAGWVRDLPEGLDTAVGSGGVDLDPARAQQVALARVVLLDPHTVVLDEATSLLDPRTARAAERSLAAVLEGRTVIAIAHRLHTAHDADRVAVVEGGRITEIGPHDELIAAGGAYAALWASWHGTD
ncbi:ABC transporter ATP-binding protein [Nocardiopsis sp. JB363]|uniref:ABC transporter ATP-binding protein n=1 Tax=Nocardiopsis sp. JB363 TaxID=1434837 RepID=UPI00097AD438|nr:ABC transporter ATP-binding protein [Nocardiopsis sp. JB363]SIO86073.1 Putative ABC iron siderophore transporter, fused permease and ATPase domains [Nocardiopsis sp. JB363]